MKKLIIGLLTALVLCTSCAEQYIVEGTSSVPQLEGETLYLKVFRNNDMQVIDSTQVTHGRFSFTGTLDSTILANLYMGEMSIMPLVLEKGQVHLSIEQEEQTATGTPLNDSLSAFVRQKAQIEYALADLPHRESQMIMNGMEHDMVLRQLSEEAHLLNTANDQLVTRFIKQNYTNVLGPGIFMVITSTQRYPLLTPQLEAITINAPAYFLEHPYVKQYLKAAEDNRQKLQDR